MNVRIALRAFLVFAVVATSVSLTSQRTEWRLSRTVVPDHYRLHFAPDFTSDTFAGDETIDMRLIEPTDRITVHAAEIDFHTVTVTAAGRSQTAQVTRDGTNETVTFKLRGRLASGPASIHITYTGYLNNKLRGLYLSRSNNRKYAITQLEATDARRAFPSFDEPAFKATFDVSATIDQGDTAISNGRVVADTPGPEPGKHTVRFSTSPKMSSYLVALAVGDFQCLSGAADGIPIRICATPDKVRLGEFALEAAEFTMQFYNRYFAIKYPFEKLDVVAVPDFAAGAMENTGAIFYRERLLTIDDKNASVEARRNVAAVLAHEMAHHWFGDLVTMKWWDDIWLNEGFAQWMENKPVREWKPAWGAELVEAADTQRALTVDALRSTRAIRTPAETPEEINELFDAIAYEKSAAVLRMAEQYVGPEVFRRGINNYLKKYSYLNASAEDFWAEIAAVSGKPVDRIMASFVDQKGSPLINVRAECADGTTRVTLSQERFIAASPAAPAPVSARPDRDRPPVWQLPICLKRSMGAGRTDEMCELLAEPVQSDSLRLCSQWVYANAGGMGVYRTAYEPEMVRRLASVAESDLLPVERISLLGDEWALVREGRDTLSSYLSLAEGVARDRSAAVIAAVTGRLDYVGEYLVRADQKPRYQAWIRQTLEPAARELGWNSTSSEADDQPARRGSIFYTLGWSGADSDTVRAARGLTLEYLDGAAKPDPAVLATAIQLAAASGDATLYDRMLERFRRGGDPAERQRFLNALARFSEPALIRRTIDLALSDEVRSQDAPALLGALFSNPRARDMTWQVVKARWPELERRFGVFQGIPQIVRATSAFCDEAARQDLAAFFEHHRLPAVTRSLQRILENVDACIALKSRSEDELGKFLDSHQ